MSYLKVASGDALDWQVRKAPLELVFAVESVCISYMQIQRRSFIYPLRYAQLTVTLFCRLRGPIKWRQRAHDTGDSVKLGFNIHCFLCEHLDSIH